MPGIRCEQKEIIDGALERLLGGWAAVPEEDRPTGMAGIAATYCGETEDALDSPTKRTRSLERAAELTVLGTKALEHAGEPEELADALIKIDLQCWVDMNAITGYAMPAPTVPVAQPDAVF